MYVSGKMFFVLFLYQSIQLKAEACSHKKPCYREKLTLHALVESRIFAYCSIWPCGLAAFSDNEPAELVPCCAWYTHYMGYCLDWMCPPHPLVSC